MDKSIIIAISLIVIVAIAIALFMTRFTSTVIFVDPRTIQRTVGQDFTINITISSVADLYGWSFRLKWNTAILEAVDVAEGPFLRNGGNTTFIPIINSTAGYVVVYCSLLDYVPGVNGTGILATIRFHVKQAGSCVLDLYNTELRNFAEQLIPHSVNDGQFST